MNNVAPENTASLQGRIDDLEQQLRLADEGNARLAARCLSLEQEVQTYLAAHAPHEKQTDSPALLQPVIYYNTGFGFSEKEILRSKDCNVDLLNNLVSAVFELPAAAVGLRLDPGELPCCLAQVGFSDDRVLWHPVNGIPLKNDSVLFLNNDPNCLLDGVSPFPAGMELTVNYRYYPLEDLLNEPLFLAVLESVRQLDQNKNSELQHIAALEQALQDAGAAQQQTSAALQKTIAELQQKNFELQAKSQAYEASLESVLSSRSWKLTSPIRRLLGLFHRSNGTEGQQ